jgi:alpha-1,3/alpha-1,6-mannosyltransferase
LDFRSDPRGVREIRDWHSDFYWTSFLVGPWTNNNGRRTTGAPTNAIFKFFTAAAQKAKAQSSSPFSFSSYDIITKDFRRFPLVTMDKAIKKNDKDATSTKPLKIVFIHLDLGIGGAEQLVLQLATAATELGHSVELVTTRCDADHCFASVAPGGALHDAVKIYGNWIPANLGGLGTALLSTLRILFLTWQVCRNHRSADICVVDVLPTSLPVLWSCLPSAATFFYCHFPDKLLLRSKANSSLPKQVYRFFLDTLEELTMSVADLIVVNSKFTRDTVLTTFPTLRPPDADIDDCMPVLYPALDTTATTPSTNEPKTSQSPIVSLNRYERKKNIMLLLYAYQYLVEEYPNEDLPPLIVAGGYDTKNVENVEYRAELQRIVDEKLNVTVDFRLDISDQERSMLFQTALGVVYTPNKEHFGIVPLEAMYAETPVLAVNSGGPMETIVDGKTGFLRQPSPQEFGEALLEWIRDPSKATAMGKAGKHHVESTFGTKRLAKEFANLLAKCQENQLHSRPNYVLWAKVGVYMVDAIFAMVFAIILTSALQQVGVLLPEESIIGGLKRTYEQEEL